MKKTVVLLLSLLLLAGCGYKPSAQLAKSVIGESVYVYVSMSRIDPQNTVLIKDAIQTAFVDRFGSKITSQSEAAAILNVSLAGVDFSPLVYDANGYVISYRTIAKLKIDYALSSGEKGSVITKGEYDFPIEADSIISDTRRFEAIRYASADAIDEFTAIVAIKGLQREQKQN
ncbi:MAG: LPS assembly lipoprotein LptE [Campylobacteraceae bacterium]|jgi:hypothetical protein|nr:LPS assembly lipoprotein LptE [Campylobacteraceae bacterium]